MKATPLQNASWIWMADAPKADTYLCFRKQWKVAGEVAGAFVDLSVDSDFVLYLNGEEVGRGQYSDFPHRKSWSRFEIGAHLRAGENILAVLVFHRGESFSEHFAGPGGLLLAVGGVEGGVVSGEGWRVRLHPAYRHGAAVRMTRQCGFTFEYDARREATWTAPGFDDGDWAEAIVTQPHWQGGPHWQKVEPRPLPHLVVGEMPPVSMVMQGSFYPIREGGNVAEAMAGRALLAQRPTELFTEAALACPRYYDGPPPDPGRWLSPGSPQPLVTFPPPSGAGGWYFILDLGEERVGWLEFEIEAAPGTVVDIAHGEHLEDGRVRMNIDGRFFADRYLCGEGRRRFQMPFRRFAARYLEVHLHGAATLWSFGLRPVEYPGQRLGGFSVADPLAMRLHEMSVRTLELCRHEHYEDCPWREQALYGFDGRLQAIYGYYAFGDTDFPEASFSLLAESFEEDGFLSLTAPGARGYVIPIFSFHWVGAVADHYLYSGRLSLYHRFAPVIEAMLTGALSRCDPASGLYLPPVGADYWPYYEWTRGLAGDGEKPLLHALHQLALHEALRCWSTLLRADGRDPSTWEVAAASLRKRFDATFWDEEEGAYTSYAPEDRSFHEAVQVCALREGVGTPERRARLVATLQQERFPAMMLAGHYLFLDALLEHAPEALPWFAARVEARWMPMALSGTTTLWETEAGSADFYYAGSLCHGWNALPVFYHQAVILGVQALTPGFATFRVRVYPERYAHASGTIPTPHGPITVAWQREREGLHLHLSGPAVCRPVLESFPGFPVASALYNGSPF